MITVDQITPEWLRKADGKLVWVRWDYLSMMGYEDRPEVLAILEHTWDLKTTMERSGVMFVG